MKSRKLKKVTIITQTSVGGEVIRVHSISILPRALSETKDDNHQKLTVRKR
jgi:hypothetical protein